MEGLRLGEPAATRLSVEEREQLPADVLPLPTEIEGRHPHRMAVQFAPHLRMERAVDTETGRAPVNPACGSVVNR